MSDLKTVIVTGANSGLGFGTSKRIASNKDYRVILACRNSEKGLKAEEDIKNSTGNDNVKFMLLDTSSFASIRNFVNEFKKLNIKLDALVCNAGISPMHSGTTVDGFELVFETNYLGHFLLTNLLLPVMSDNGRVINVTSDMHNPPRGISWKAPEELAHPSTNDMQKYSYSKLCNIYFTYELDKRLRKINSRIVVNAFNPGMMMTNFSGGHNDPARAAMIKLTMPERVGDTDTSSDALARITVNPEFESITGKYFDRSTNYKRSSDLSYNNDNMLDLWNKSVTWTKLDKSDTLKGLLDE